MVPLKKEGEGEELEKRISVRLVEEQEAFSLWVVEDLLLMPKTSAFAQD